MTDSCCESAAVCVFSRALHSRVAVCALASRRSLGERELIECRSPPARINCGTLAELMRERARFALRLPPASQPLMHAQALRLHCGALVGLRQVLDDGSADIHGLVRTAQERYGGLAELPWGELVPHIVAWQPRVRRRPLP